jgi:hypothetical protein
MSLGSRLSDISAREALRRTQSAKKGGKSAADELNYELTMKRLMAKIGSSADRGETRLVYVAPWIVMDGTTTDPVALARRLETGLSRLGYSVERQDSRLVVDWGLDLVSQETELKRKKEAERKQKAGDAKLTRQTPRRRGRPMRPLK